MNMTEQPQAPWYSGVTRYQWLVLLIASLGWIFDVFEGQIFMATCNPALRDLLGAASSEGNVAYYKSLALAAFLVGGALGGVGFGTLSDRIGRVRTMMFTILVYSCFTCLTYFVWQPWQIVALRFLVAMGIGGEWAVASAMVAEVFPKNARAWSLGIFHASSIFGLWAATATGWIVASPAIGWRWGYAVGLLPALLTLWIYASLKEPDAWVHARQEALAGRAPQGGRIQDLFTVELRRNALVGLALATVGLATFWAVYVEGWNLMRKQAEDYYLSQYAQQVQGLSRHDALSKLPADVQTAIWRWNEMGAMFLISTGGGLGLISCGPLSNRIGRRGVFRFFCLGGVVAALGLFKVLPLGPGWLLWLALPVFGYFTTGMHAGYAIYFPELFPTRLRGAGSGFCFNGGRLLAAPILILSGSIQKDLGMSLENTASLLSLLFLLGVVVLWFAPETKGKELPT